MTPEEFIQAARVPDNLQPQSFGVWKIMRKTVEESCHLLPAGPARELRQYVGFQTYTLLCRPSWKTMHTAPDGEVVMDDSRRELRRHLPIWLAARGRVLLTGLGLGCVARGLLANPAVDSVTVVEIDKTIIRVIGEEFATNERIEIIHGDALTARIPGSWDFAWHDIWTDGDESLHLLHARLVAKFIPQAPIQGAWQFPRLAKRKMPAWFLR